MKTFQIVSFLALLASAMAFAPVDPKIVKVAAGVLPAAAIAPAAFAMDSVVDALPSSTVSLMVQEGAYLAVLLGTLLPCLFLVNLFIQTETRAAGRAGGQDSE